MTRIMLHPTSLDDDLYKYYHNAFGMSKEIFDLYSNFYVLEMTVSGFSVKDIMLELPGMSEEEIRSVLSDYFAGFTGFENTLDINPIMWYNTHNQDDYSFRAWIRELYPDLTSTLSFMVKEYTSLELLLDAVVK